LLCTRGLPAAAASTAAVSEAMQKYYTSRAGVGTHTVVLVTAVRPLLRNGASGTLASAMLETMKRALFLAHCALAAAAVVV